MANFLNDSIEGFNELAKATEKWKKELLKTVEITQKGAKGVNTTKVRAEDINKLAQAEKALVKTEEELIEVTKEELKWEKKIKEAKSQKGKVLAENRVILAELNKKNKEAARVSLGLVKAYERESKSLNDMRKKYKNMAMSNLGATKAAKDLLSKITKLDKKLKAVDKTVGQNQRSVGDYTNSIKDAASQSGIFSSQLAVLNQIQGTVNALLKLNTSDTEFNTIAKNTNSAATKKLTRFQKLQALASGGAAKAMKVLNMALKASPLFLLAGALGGLAAMFTRTQKGVDSVSSSFAGLSAGVDVVIDRFSNVGEGLKSLFSGDIEKGLSQLGNSFKGVTAEIKEEVKAAKELKDAEHELRDLEMEWLITKAEIRREVEKSRLLAKDESKSNSEKLKYLDDAIDKEKELLDLELNAQTERVRILREQVALANSLDEEKLSLAEAEAALIDLETASFKRRRTIESERRTFLRKIAKEELDRHLNNEKRRIELIDNLRIKAFENEKLRYDKELKAAKKNKEDLELVELVHQKKIEEIQKKFRRQGIKESKELQKIIEDRDEAFGKKKVESGRKLKGEVAEVDNSAIDAADLEYAESLERRREEEIAFARSVTEETGAELDKRMQEKLESLNKEQSDIQKSISIQEGLAAKGLENSLAFEQEALAKNQLEILEQEKKAANLKEAQRLGELFLTLKEAEAQEKVQGSTARALAGVAEAKATTQLIKAGLDEAGFSEGGYTGDGGKYDAAGIVHKGEFVIDKETTKSMGLRGADMSDFNTMFSMHEMNKSDRVVQDSNGNYKVIEAVENLNQTLKNKPEQFMDFDKFGNFIIENTKGGKKTRTMHKINSRL